MSIATRPEKLHYSDYRAPDPTDVRLPDDGSQAGLGVVIVIGFAAAFWFGLGAACAYLLNGP